jgi:hypothetical protein
MLEMVAKMRRRREGDPDAAQKSLVVRRAAAEILIRVKINYDLILIRDVNP